MLSNVCYNSHSGKQVPTLVSILWSLRSIRAGGAALGVGTHPRIQWASRWGVGGHRRSRLRRSKLRASLVPLHVGHEAWNKQTDRKKHCQHLAQWIAWNPKNSSVVNVPAQWNQMLTKGLSEGGWVRSFSSSTNWDIHSISLWKRDPSFWWKPWSFTLASAPVTRRYPSVSNTAWSRY